MNKFTILSEIELPELEHDGFGIQKLSYGNRFFNFIFHNYRGKVLRKFADNKDIAVIVCGRAAAMMVNNMNFPNLRLIQLTSTGFDGVPVVSLQRRGIKVANLRNIYTLPIAETVVYTLLRFTRKLNPDPKNMWPRLTRGYANWMTELAGKKVLLLGTGNIGTAIADRLAAFEMQIDGYSLEQQTRAPYNIIYSDHLQLLSAMQQKQYDFVISSMPSTADTLDFCDLNFFEAMGPKAIFINIGRAATVDQQALYQALKNGIIKGAAIDSVELLPFAPFNRFRRLHNTVVLPGIAASSEESGNRVKKRISDNIKIFAATGSCHDLL